jgi:cytidyltransferase-like protein
MKLGIVSGFWNPIHAGHLEYIHAARQQCDQLLCIVNSDHQVAIKGSKPFMDQNHRMIIMAQFRDVNLTLVAVDKDKTVCETLKLVRTMFASDVELLFFNSGDRALVNNTEFSEVKVCNEYNIKYVAIPLPKIYSSSTLIADSSK